MKGVVMLLQIHKSLHKEPGLTQNNVLELARSAKM